MLTCSKYILVGILADIKVLEEGLDEVHHLKTIGTELAKSNLDGGSSTIDFIGNFCQLKINFVANIWLESFESCFGGPCVGLFFSRVSGSNVLIEESLPVHDMVNRVKVTLTDKVV
jgi:hypothetical protein